MIFATRPVQEAQGSLLAHSVDVPTGRLRKGTVLDASHVKALKLSGVGAVTVATLESGDVEENEAAHRLGKALMHGASGLHASVAATGRVNIFADSAGVALLDVDRLTCMNALNPMITFATVPPHHQMHKGGMLGTVKIISYAVSEADLEQACMLAAGTISLATPVGQTVSLIITQIKNTQDESKAIAATKARVTALDATLIEVLTCAHQTEALIEKINQATGDVILILTGSATSDPADVGPAALISAGGQLIRFGMPVDPGNLLFLGDINGRTVIGLPGCARSPALNGADKVLCRVLCGVPVTSVDIAGMGVGGLLKEIPTRPRPRQASDDL